MTWQQDRPSWSTEDEWAAQTVEAIGWARHELASLLLWLGGQKPNLPEPQRIEHSDRPDPKQVAREITRDPDEIASFFGLQRREVNAR